MPWSFACRSYLVVCQFWISLVFYVHTHRLFIETHAHKRLISANASSLIECAGQLANRLARQMATSALAHFGANQCIGWSPLWLFSGAETAACLLKLRLVCHKNAFNRAFSVNVVSVRLFMAAVAFFFFFEAR